MNFLLFFLIDSTQKMVNYWSFIIAKIKAWQYKILFLVLWMLKSRTMWVYSALRPWDSTMHLCRHNMQKTPSSTYTSRKGNQRACSLLEAVGGRAFASAPACGDSPRPVCGREGSRRTRMEPGAAGVGDAAGAAITPRPAGSCSGVAPEEPPPRLVPAPGGWAQPERRGKWSPKRAPKRSPSIPWACACVPEPSPGDRAVFFPRHRRP